MSTSVKVSKLPSCDLCKPAVEPAYVDGATVMGAWAYMCAAHFATHGVGLGLGRGQRLIEVGEEA